MTTDDSKVLADLITLLEREQYETDSVPPGAQFALGYRRGHNALARRLIEWARERQGV